MRVALVMALFTFSLLVLLRLAFRWDPLMLLAWVSAWFTTAQFNLAGPVQHFKAAVLDAWRNKVAADLCGREGFRRGPLLDVHGSVQLLDHSNVREKG